ncbi:protein of unknown function [Moritella yayanosii]|uniref:Uncharacterized protein n=1 Tax=Moritella yayanosii TaxID=69539 RepID=A0A330LK53_9GAMM|nr:protein of unknown function [Moritella yayanosii]
MPDAEAPAIAMITQELDVLFINKMIR